MLLGLAVILPAYAGGHTLTVRLDAADVAVGVVRCSLYAADAAEHFPNQPRQARTVETQTEDGSPTCVFRGLPAGRYAFAGLVDHNENGKLDTTAVGRPTEPWGISNNVRPRLRAPTFDEAAIDLADEALTIEVQLR